MVEIETCLRVASDEEANWFSNSISLLDKVYLTMNDIIDFLPASHQTTAMKDFQ